MSTPPTLTIKVQLFAAYREAFGCNQLVWQVAAGTTAGDLLDRLLADRPELERWRKVTRLGVNLSFVPPETVLADGDEVAPIPPVSGG